jgi:FkbM family methyltransferase
MKIGIYIGTSARDIIQYKALVNSIKMYNIDSIPVYTCVNDDDIELFEQEFKDYSISFFKDSDVFKTGVTNSWYKQQIIKMNFWRLGLVDIMIQIDSDSFFIKNFYISDFMVREDIPYTILHENKELKEFFSRYNLHGSRYEDNGDFKILQGFAENSSKIRSIFQTSNISVEYDYGHPPCIWSNKVWEALYEKYLKPNNISYESLLEYANSEQQWYGETLIALDLFPIFPKENMFKTFHYRQDYADYLKENSIQDIKYTYHGICLQSNWSANTSEFNNVYSNFFTENLDPKNYNGQFGEDKWILDNIKIPKTGTVIDVGADQPIYGSNTYYFEKYLGWDSYCIDADERVIQKLKSKRKNTIFCAVSDVDGTVKFNQHSLAGISSLSEIGNVEVPCKTLNTILKENKIQEITLLDIDVEGYELQVCNGLDWKIYKPQIVIIEFISPSGGNIKNQLVEFFNNLKTYKLVHTSQSNLIFIYETL